MAMETSALPKDFYEATSAIDAELSVCLRDKPEFCTWVLEKWLCCRCKVLPVRAWSARCCHAFCSDCIQEIIAFKEKCPRDAVPIWRTQFLRRPDIEKEVSRTFVRCPFGCDSNYPVEKLLMHRAECTGYSLTSGSTVSKPIECVESCTFRGKCKLYEIENQVLNDKLNSQMIEMENLNCKFKCLQLTGADELTKMSKERDALTKTVEQLKQRVTSLEESQFDPRASVSSETCVTPIFETNILSGSDHDDLTVNEVGLEQISDDSSSCAESVITIASFSNTPTATCTDIVKNLSILVTSLREKVQLSRQGTEIPYRSEEFCVDSGGHMLQIEVYLNGLPKVKGKWMSVLIKAVENDRVRDEASWPLTKHIRISLQNPVLRKKEVSCDCLVEFHKPPSSQHTFSVNSFLEKKLLESIISEQDYMILNFRVRDEVEVEKKTTTQKKSGMFRNRK